MNDFLNAMSVLKDCSQQENPLQAVKEVINRNEFTPLGVHLQQLYPQLEAFFTCGTRLGAAQCLEEVAIEELSIDSANKF